MVLCLGDKVPILPVIKATSRITLDSLRSIKSIFFLRYSLKETFVCQLYCMLLCILEAT